MPSPNLSPCANCHARCCKKSIVPISGYDMWRIARGLEYPPERFVALETRAHPDSHSFYLERTGPGYTMILNKIGEGEEKGCMFFLELPGGTGRCGIYELRPNVCRTYPAAMSGLDVVKRTDVICPENAWLDGTLLAPVWRNNLFRITVEFDIYRVAVERWNRRVLRSSEARVYELSDYFSYALDFYDRLAPVRESVGSKGWWEMCEWWGKVRLDGVGPLVDPSIDPGPWRGVIEAVREVAATILPPDPTELPPVKYPVWTG